MMINESLAYLGSADDAFVCCHRVDQRLCYSHTHCLDL